jgi:hypothetical protein
LQLLGGARVHLHAARAVQGIRLLLYRRLVALQNLAARRLLLLLHLLDFVDRCDLKLLTTFSLTASFWLWGSDWLILAP